GRHRSRHWARSRPRRSTSRANARPTRSSPQRCYPPKSSAGPAAPARRDDLSIRRFHRSNALSSSCPFLADAGSCPGNCPGMEETTGAPSSWTAYQPRRLRASSRDAGGVMNRPPSPLTMLLSRHTRRRDFITVIPGAAVAWPMALRADESGRSARVAYLSLAGDEDAALVKQRLDELGYHDGKNLIFDFRSAEGRLERLHELAAKFVATNPDVIVTGFGTETAKAAQAATSAIPIIFTSVGDPIGAGIVKSLGRPDKNITGLTSQTAEISGKRLQILEELAPGIRIIAVIVSPGYPFTAVALPQLRTAASARGLRLEV